MMMALLPIATILIGVLLGIRFNVLILLPAMLVGAILTLSAGVAQGSDFWIGTLAVILESALLQIGYLIGAHRSVAGRSASAAVSATSSQELVP
jgi:hypothetical protein